MASAGPGIHGRHVSREDNAGGAVPFLYKLTTVAATASYTLAEGREFDIEVIDAWAVPNAAAVGGTVTVKNGTDAITSAIVAAVDTTKTHTTLIDDDYAVVGKDDVLTVTTANAATADVYILCIKA